MILQPTGLDYLALVTELLHDDPGRVYEAADVQWWYRKHRHLEPGTAAVWTENGAPVSAAVITDWGRMIALDVFGRQSDEAWAWGLAALPRRDVPVTTTVAEGDPVPPGFAPDGGVYLRMWRDADAEPPVTALPAGYRVRSRAAHPDGPHHLIGRNGADVEAGLQQTSLYDADGDLAIVAPDGTVAAYGIFWPDPATGVGLVEPIRVEDAHAGRGLARHLVAVGSQWLVTAGCTRLKVTPEADNAPAVKAYAAAGFVATGRDLTCTLR